MTTTLNITSDSPEARKFLEYALSLPFVEKIKGETREKSQFVLDYEASLKPMTMEEYHAMLDEAEDDFRNGRVISHEEMGRWIAGIR